MSFGVYLIHVNPLVWEFVMKDRFKSFLNFNIVSFVLGVLGIAVTIYFLCILIEWVRIRIFKKLKVKEKIEGIVKL